MVDSKSTDKLKIVCDSFENTIINLPELHSKLKSINIIWKEVDGVAVPNVNIEFYESSTLKLDKTE